MDMVSNAFDAASAATMEKQMIEIIKNTEACYADGKAKYSVTGSPRPVLTLTHGIDNSDIRKIISIMVEGGRASDIMDMFISAGGLKDDIARAAASKTIHHIEHVHEQPIAAPEQGDKPDDGGNGDYYVFGRAVPRMPHSVYSSALAEAERIAGREPGCVVRVVRQVAWRQVENVTKMNGRP